MDRGEASSNRYTSLDGLRGVAALTVIFFHVRWPNHVTGLQFFRNSYMAVDLFFLLSGFVIAASYSHQLNVASEARTFLLRRFFRVYPLHAAILLLLTLQEATKFIALARGMPVNQPPFTGVSSGWLLLANVLFIQGSGFVPTSSWNPPAWTVSSEAFAYLAFALLGLAGLVRRPGAMLAAAGVGAMAYAAMVILNGTLDLTAHAGILRCLAGFFMGVALYQWRQDGAPGWLAEQPGPVLTALEILAVLAVLGVMSFAQGGQVVWVMPCFIVLLALLQRGGGAVSRMLAGPVCQRLGLISYSVYLVHVPVRTVLLESVRRLGLPTHYPPGGGGMMLDVGPATGDALLVALIVAAILAACATYKLIEEPARLLGRKITSPRGLVTADRPALQRL